MQHQVDMGQSSNVASWAAGRTTSSQHGPHSSQKVSATDADARRARHSHS